MGHNRGQNTKRLKILKKISVFRDPSNFVWMGYKRFDPEIFPNTRDTFLPFYVII